MPSRSKQSLRRAVFICTVPAILCIILLVGPREDMTGSSSLLSRVPIQFAYTYRGGRVESIIAECEAKGCAARQTFEAYIPIYDFLRGGMEQGYYDVRIGIYPGIPSAIKPGQTVKVYLNGSPLSILTFSEQTADGLFVLDKHYVDRYAAQPDQPGWDMVLIGAPANTVRDENIITVDPDASVHWAPTAAVILISPRTDFIPWWRGQIAIVQLIALAALSACALFLFVWKKSMAL